MNTMQPPETQHYEPISREGKFVHALDKAIDFHRTNQNDPYGISNAVICALTETREAFAQTFGFPLIKREKK